MDKIHPNALRQKFLDFFASKAHLVHAPASLKSDDPALMFNVAGMQQFKTYFQGASPRFSGYEGLWPRVVTAQRCMRAGGKDSDIENIGRTRRHHTMFEMLGNFSFGDYFKREAAEWAWEFLTSPEWLGIDPERLYVTVFLDDDEAFDIWTQHVGVPAERLSRFGEKDNFWPANAIKDERSGPCGPCSEIFYDRGPAYGSPDETGPNTGSGDRYMEIWNLVFTQFDLVDGVLHPLPQKNIDTGMGFERLVTVVNGAQDAYDTELFQPSIRRLVELTGLPYQDLDSVQHRIIADHVRSVTFAISDGILPANDGAGYVIKMLIRRAARQAYLLGVREPILHKLVAGVVESMGAGYPDIIRAQARVENLLKTEEEQFLRTLETGTQRVHKLLTELQGTVLPGDVAFDLWDTYGFPLDLTRDMAEERGVTVDAKGYEAARDQARQLSRAGQTKGAMFATVSELLDDIVATHGETIFEGYSSSETSSQVLGILRDGQEIAELSQGNADIALNISPFYPEGGGQVGDSGKLEWDKGSALVTGTLRSPQGVILHRIRVLRGVLKAGMQVTARVDPARLDTQKHHTATHLLHAALRSVLGSHVSQAGSLVTAERLRFDFSHPQAVTAEEIVQIETLVNRWIQADFPVSWQEVPIAEAQQAGAMMLFGEKYGEQVRMVSIGHANTVSIELCGGTHVAHTGEIGSFYISTEEAVSAGVRRIEALSGTAAVRYTQSMRATSLQIARLLGGKAADATERIGKLQQELKSAQRENSQLRDKLAAAQTASDTTLKEAATYRYLASVLEGLDANALRTAADSLLQKSGADLVVLASGTSLVAKVSKDAQAKGAHAGTIVRELAKRAGGGGGGRPDMAQAGVKDGSRIPAALEALPEILEAL